MYNPKSLGPNAQDPELLRCKLESGTPNYSSSTRDTRSLISFYFKRFVSHMHHFITTLIVTQPLFWRLFYISITKLDYIKQLTVSESILEIKTMIFRTFFEILLLSALFVNKNFYMKARLWNIFKTTNTFVLKRPL